MTEMKTAKPLTGRKVLTILLVAFGIIVTVNMALLYNAVKTFPGLEVKNSYVASQTFDDRAAAQRALGWDPEVSYGDGQVYLSIFANGEFIFPDVIGLRVGRPTHGREDFYPTLSREANGYTFDADLDVGKWFVYVSAQDANGEPFEQRLELFVTDAHG